jgi:hypothetical protein
MHGITAKKLHLPYTVHPTLVQGRRVSQVLIRSVVECTQELTVVHSKIHFSAQVVIVGKRCQGPFSAAEKGP